MAELKKYTQSKPLQVRSYLTDQTVNQQMWYYVTTVVVPDETRRKFLSESKEWAENLGSLRGSIEGGEGNVAGRYGELVFQSVFGGTIADDYEFDIEYGGITFDVKTKRRTVKAKENYEASVADFNSDQDADMYYFISVRCGDVDTPYRHVDLLGYIPNEHYYEKSSFRKKGQKDRNNGFVFKADCHNLRYYELERHTALPRTLHL